MHMARCDSGRQCYVMKGSPFILISSVLMCALGLYLLILGSGYIAFGMILFPLELLMVVFKIRKGRDYMVIDKDGLHVKQFFRGTHFIAWDEIESCCFDYVRLINGYEACLTIVPGPRASKHLKRNPSISLGRKSFLYRRRRLVEALKEYGGDVYDDYKSELRYEARNRYYRNWALIILFVLLIFAVILF